MACDQFAFRDIHLVRVFLLILAAYFSSAVLFRPLRNLTLELHSMSSQLDRKLGQSLSGFVIGSELSRLSRGGRSTRDEFELLCAEIENFLRKLEGYTRSFNAQSAILTHELKTPLTVLRNCLEELRRADDLDRAKDMGRSALEEIERLTKLINDYLQWSVLTSNPGQPNEIYAVKLSEITAKLVADFNSIHGNRILLRVSEEAHVFALPDHVRQLVSNLLSNAVNYSPPEKPVECEVAGDALTVTDHGPGIPADVREHMGSPFNRGQLNRGQLRSPGGRTQSSGLGLAWVSSLCDKYGWTLAIESSPSGTTVRVHFS
ncbi:MAG: HAMP domain-containing histidine kinase [Calothrix sp. SM1_5_4]|nr:HAMP domain-containing histidine kinase [Calothrix sp. SM1_5_4]